MNEDDLWVYFDGPEPERVRLFLDALRDLPPATPADEERLGRRLLEGLDALLARRREERRAREGETGEAEQAGEVAARRAEGDGDSATVRSPLVEDRGDAPVVAEDRGSAPEVREVPEARARAGLVSTTMAMEIPAERRELPFRPLRPGEVPALKTIAKTEVLRVIGLEPGQTTPVGDDSIERAVRAAKALPFVKAAGEAVVLLTVEQFASLQAELAVSPEERAGILARYGVAGEVGLRAVYADWEMRFAEGPGVRAVFEARFAEFRDYLRQGKIQGGGAGSRV